MQAEIIAIGTEILMGQITNTNGAYMAKQLATLGIASYHQQVVGDNAKRLADAISLAEQRSDIVILIGGLGPTPDDLTKQTLAAHLNLPLVEDAGAMAKLAARVKQQQRPMTPNNRLQAMYPKAQSYWPIVSGWRSAHGLSSANTPMFYCRDHLKSLCQWLIMNCCHDWQNIAGIRKFWKVA